MTTGRRIVTTERVARKRHTCDGCSACILAGDTYLEHRLPAHFEGLGNNTPLIKRECLSCAGRQARLSDQALEHHAIPLFDLDGVA